tara:strand:+ start:273 stop:1178 length:906 start_codon:yes stop_codon:yes gene_type:complete
MKNTLLTSLLLLGITLFASCAQNKQNKNCLKLEEPLENIQKQERHNYGGWYCPDNLNGFPPTDISNWKKVPVVNGRLPTREETQNGTSLIFVDKEKFPDARPMEMEMPKLASYYNENSKKEELVIVIQALSILNDSVVGFRYLNGGNGSARLSEVRFLEESEIEEISGLQFVSLTVQIEASQKDIWNILTNPGYYTTLQDIFDAERKHKTNWNNASKVNFKYAKEGMITSEFSAYLFDNQYIQIDFKLGDEAYVEKFLLLENEETKTNELKIVCGPYYEDDYEIQKEILNKWAHKVKTLSE